MILTTKQTLNTCPKYVFTGDFGPLRSRKVDVRPTRGRFALSKSGSLGFQLGNLRQVQTGLILPLSQKDLQ